ncbi:MAG: DUF5915 domain-containing protein, partial [Bacteroidales bacterium]
GRLTVALDNTITEDHRKEGIARELVNRIQNLRKSGGLEITDKIDVTISRNPLTDEAVEVYKNYIASQVLANSVELGEVGADASELEMDDFSLYAEIRKA